MNRLTIILSLASLAAFSAFSARAAEPVSGPTVEQALQAFKTQDSLKVELVVSEPLTASPCAMAFDERGRLYVAENRGYPRGPAEGEPPMGVIALLEDLDHDGRMDKRTVFADGLSFPNGVLPWKDGLIATCSPDLLFLRDTDGDGRADERTVLLTGFDTQKSTQLRVNGPTVGPDGFIWLASGLSGGRVSNPAHPEFEPLELKGDLRYDPRTGRFDAVAGRSQYGHSIDFFGRRFICMNRVQVQHVVMPLNALRHNPNFAFSDTVQNCPEPAQNYLLRGGAGAARIFPISQNITTADSHAGTFSAACGVYVWQGGNLTPEFFGSVFSCDPTGNLIHVDRLESRGASFAAVPLLNGTEFLASRDDWFRPVFLTSGPDGALYVCDMTRKVIEHPDYLPEEVRKHTDFESGRGLGRIWRVVRKKGASAPAVIPAQQTTEQWIARLGSMNAWERQTAFRKLVEQQPVSFAEPLTSAFERGLRPDTVVSLMRLAKYTDSLREPLLLRALRHRDPEVREVALAMLPATVDAELRIAVHSLAKDIDPKVRFHCALALGGLGAGAEDALVEIARRDGGDKWTRAAVLGSAGGREAKLLEMLLESKSTVPQAFIASLSKLIAKTTEASKRAVVLHALLERAAASEPVCLAVAAGFSDALPAIVPGSLLAKTVEAAKQAARQPGSVRLLAIELLGGTNFEAAGEGLLALLSETDAETQAASVTALARFGDRQTADALLEPKRWNALAPALRDSVLNALVSRPALAEVLLDHIEAKTIFASSVDSRRRQVLLASRDSRLKERATKLFSQAASGDRMKAFDSAKDVLALAPHPDEGREVFRRACASCHRMDREGYAVGPDLFDIRRQTKENILLHIVVPEFEIAPGFISYLVEAQDGRTLLGVMSSETPESITLRQPGGQEDTILRGQIKSLQASPLSLMPQGFESALKRQELADLLAYLRGEG
jgi:putative membrane-bound dehydrogenase-like protein